MQETITEIKLFEFEGFFKNKSDLLEYKPVGSIKKDEKIPLPVKIDKISHFLTENIIENMKKEIQDYIDLCLNFYGEDIKQSDQSDQDEK